jgi:hypothetical protein
MRPPPQQLDLSFESAIKATGTGNERRSQANPGEGRSKKNQPDSNESSDGHGVLLKAEDTAFFEENRAGPSVASSARDEHSVSGP